MLELLLPTAAEIFSLSSFQFKRFKRFCWSVLHLASRRWDDKTFETNTKQIQKVHLPCDFFSIWVMFCFGWHAEPSTAMVRSLPKGKVLSLKRAQQVMSKHDQCHTLTIWGLHAHTHTRIYTYIYIYNH